VKPGRDDPRRLPGTLCDETPETPPAPRAVAGRWKPRPDDDAIPTPIHDRLRDEYGALLLERDEAVAKLAAAEARIRGLEETVRAYAAHHSPRRMAMHGADGLPAQPHDTAGR
jgi:hypothetical protein